jgi:hypothetical protein
LYGARRAADVRPEGAGPDESQHLRLHASGRPRLRHAQRTRQPPAPGGRPPAPRVDQGGVRVRSDARRDVQLGVGNQLGLVSRSVRRRAAPERRPVRDPPQRRRLGSSVGQATGSRRSTPSTRARPRRRCRRSTRSPTPTATPCSTTPSPLTSARARYNPAITTATFRSWCSAARARASRAARS